MTGVGVRVHQKPIAAKQTGWSIPLSESSSSQEKG